MNKDKYRFGKGERECSLEPDNTGIIVLEGSELWFFIQFILHLKRLIIDVYLTVDFENVKRNI